MFVPPSDEINAQTIHEIGSFHDSNNKKIKIDEKDLSNFDKFEFFSEEKWEKEIIGL